MWIQPSISAPVHSTDKVHESKDMDTISLSSSHCQAHDTPHIHKVGIPPKQNLLKEIKATVKETFFADDPLRPFKDQTGSKRFILVMQTIFPILEWGRSYNITKFRGDIIAGLTIASLCIPQVNLLWLLKWRNSHIIPSRTLQLFPITFLLLAKQDIGYAKLANLDPQYGLCKFALICTYALP